MLHVERQQAPEFMRSRKFGELRTELERFHLLGGTKGLQERFPIQMRLEPFMERIHEALASQFEGQCAYTEVHDEGEHLLHTHRPSSDAVSPDGRVDPEHYWWLMLDWDNWYLASRQVESVKSYQFPVVGERSERGEELDVGVLLDPCVDYPSWWLRFEPDGTVVPRPHPSPEVRARYEPYDRGEWTIRILDLNHHDLVDSRRNAISMGTSILWFPEKPHRAATAQIEVRRLLEGAFVENLDAKLRTVWSLAPEALAAELMAADVDPAVTRDAIGPILDYIERVHPAVAATRRFEQLRRPERIRKPKEVIEPEKAIAGETAVSKRDVVIGPTDRITSIYVKDFRAITAAQIDISSEFVDLEPKPDATGSGHTGAVAWKVLLGENGSGKSSFLQAVALALMGDKLDEVLEKAGLAWRKILRRTNGHENAQGRVLLTFTGGQQIDLRFTRNKAWFHGLHGRTPKMNINIRGYGATRLLSDDPTIDTHPAAPTAMEVANLFDPNERVTNAKGWLLSLDEGPFNVAAITLEQLLGVRSSVDTAVSDTGTPDGNLRIERNLDEGEVTVDGDLLDDVSDGYRSVIAVGCDIMAGIGGLHLDSGGFSDLANARGIVLIDEIGAHLHPRWRMEITDKLRRALPNVQFIVTTHEPLCLRGLKEREVVRVVKYEEFGVVVDEIDRAPARYRVDQLLTSEFFGLESAIDPDLDARFRRYYELRRQPALSEEEQEELDRLDHDLNQRLRPVLGYTRRDQLIYEMVDEFLDAEPTMGPRERRQRRRETIESVKELWTELASSPPQGLR